MQNASVPVGRVNSVKEVVEGEQTKFRGAVEDVWVESEKGGEVEGVGGGGGGERRYGKKGWNVQMPAVFPRLEGCDARTRWAGPELGEDTREVLMELLGVGEAEQSKLREEGVVG
jgi:crotonobetainyl-CoA:carnitine CoA-transferase CaiB-like acyl-CoA transferase